MELGSIRWILAFDADCGTCRVLSERVEAVARGKLEVIPLSSPDVEEWRNRILGPDAPHVPCLIRSRGDEVGVWTGAAMAARLSTRLGVRGTTRLLKALGEMRRNASRGCGVPRPGTLGRGQFLRLAGAGVVVAAAAVAGRAVPALADSRKLTAAQEWVLANKEDLPTKYSDVIAFDIEYRKAIFGATTPAIRSKLWIDHFEAYRDSHKEMTSIQESIITRAAEIVKDVTIFDHANATEKDSPQRHSLQVVKVDAIDAFGRNEARRLLATLGPESASKMEGALKKEDCHCHWSDDWCTSGTCNSCSCAGVADCDKCNDGNCWCNCSSYGCGTVYAYSCSGTCL